jgi:hypothetical protein
VAVMRQFDTQRSGYGGGGRDMQERIARAEAHLETMAGDLSEVKQDVRALRSDVTANYRQLLWAGISAVALLFGAIIASHLMLQSRIDGLAEKVSDIQMSVAAIAARLSPAAEPAG